MKEGVKAEATCNSNVKKIVINIFNQPLSCISPCVHNQQFNPMLYNLVVKDQVHLHTPSPTSVWRPSPCPACAAPCASSQTAPSAVAAAASPAPAEAIACPARTCLSSSAGCRPGERDEEMSVRKEANAENGVR